MMIKTTATAAQVFDIPPISSISILLYISSFRINGELSLGSEKSFTRIEHYHIVFPSMDEVERLLRAQVSLHSVC
jgi:hypothetical protein